MKYAIHQIHLSNEQIDEINTSNEVPAYYQHKLAVTMPFSDDSVAKRVKDVETAAYLYSHVGNITADSLEGVFEAGNIGPEERIERLAPMSSVSVGDVIVDEDGVASVVDSFGFTTLYQWHRFTTLDGLVFENKETI